MHHKRLTIDDLWAGRRRISGMTDAQITLQPLNCLIVEHVIDHAHAFVHIEVSRALTLGRDNAGRFLAAMLQRHQAQANDLRDVQLKINIPQLPTITNLHTFTGITFQWIEKKYTKILHLRRPFATSQSTEHTTLMRQTSDRILRIVVMINITLRLDFTCHFNHYNQRSNAIDWFSLRIIDITAKLPCCCCCWTFTVDIVVDIGPTCSIIFRLHKKIASCVLLRNIHDRIDKFRINFIFKLNK